MMSPEPTPSKSISQQFPAAVHSDKVKYRRIARLVYYKYLEKGIAKELWMDEFKKFVTEVQESNPGNLSPSNFEQLIATLIKEADLELYYNSTIARTTQDLIIETSRLFPQKQKTVILFGQEIRRILLTIIHLVGNTIPLMETEIWRQLKVASRFHVLKFLGPPKETETITETRERKLIEQLPIAIANYLMVYLDYDGIMSVSHPYNTTTRQSGKVTSGEN